MGGRERERNPDRIDWVVLGFLSNARLFSCLRSQAPSITQSRTTSALFGFSDFSFPWMSDENKASKFMSFDKKSDNGMGDSTVLGVLPCLFTI